MLVYWSVPEILGDHDTPLQNGPLDPKNGFDLQEDFLISTTTYSAISGHETKV